MNIRLNHQFTLAPLLDGADAVKIVCVGTFTADAEQFAQCKAIELIKGERLLDLVRSVQSPVRAQTQLHRQRR